MSHGKSLEKVNKAEKLLRQNPHGIRAAELAKKLGVKRTAVYDVLNSLVYRGKAESKDGLWYPKEPQSGKATKELTDREVAIRYFQWRGAPEGGNSGFFKNMFGEPEK